MTDPKKMDDLDAVRLISETLSNFKSEEQQRIIRWVQEKLNIVFIAKPKQTSETSAAQESDKIEKVQHKENAEHAHIDIRTFINSKKPNSDNQFAACVAYYYQFEATGDEKKDSITAAELQDATRKAGRSRLGDPGKTLVNASAQGWLDKKARGSYGINTVGENLVAMTLPAGSTTDSIPTRKARATKKPITKAAAKKKK